MPRLKIQFHCHCKEDPLDNIVHNAFELIDFAAKCNYNVVSITGHNLIIFGEDLRKYAEERNILLIPGMEKTIEGHHVLIINPHIEAQRISKYEELKTYRELHPESLTIAAHPCYPASIAMGEKNLAKYINLFDAVEYSWFHTQKTNIFNLKAKKIADSFNKPMLATSDNHILKYFDSGYSFVDSQKDIQSIFTAIRQNKIEMYSKNLTWWQMISSFIIMDARYIWKKLFG